MATSGASDNEASSDSLPSVTADDCCTTSDEETWLFASPRTTAHCTEWLRKDMDDPSLFTVRRSLLYKLDEIANTPKHSPQPTPNDTPKHTPRNTPSDTPRQTPDLSMSSSANTSGLVTPDSPPPYRGEIDTRTFVRPRKKKLSPGKEVPDETQFKQGDRYIPMFEKTRGRYEKSPGRYENNGSISYENNCGRYDNSMQYNTHNTTLQIQQKSNTHGSVLALSSGSLGSEDDEHLSSASEGSYCKIADVEDVNTIARLQEESLKLPDSRTRAYEENVKLATARSKMSRLPGPRFGRVSAGSSQEDLLGPPSYRGAPTHASPRRGADGWAGFSPPVSPYTSNNSLNATSGGSNGIRLMSNLSGSGMLNNYGSPVGSRGGSPARELPTASAGRRTTRLPSPAQVRGVVRSDRSRLATAGIPRPAGHITPQPASSPLHRPAARTAVGAGGVGRPRVTPTPAVPAPALLHKQQQQQQHGGDWRGGCY